MTRSGSKNFIDIISITDGVARSVRHRLTGTVIGLAAFAGCLSGCSDQTLTQQRWVSIPKQAWTHAYQPWVHIDVQDSTLPYSVYAVIRHNQQFKYDNLLLRYGYIAPGDSAIFHDVNLPLAAADKWLGDTLGTIVETRIRLAAQPEKFPLGDNVFVLGHLMPDEPLAGILQVGIRIEATAQGAGRRLQAPLQNSLADTAARPSKADALKPPSGK